MAERAPEEFDSTLQSRTDDTVPSHATGDTVLTVSVDRQRILEAGTYVVQVPKDQIYRVPPPENALIIERYQDPDKKRGNVRRPSFICCLVVAAIVTIAVAAVAAAAFLVIKPSDPVFNIEQLVVVNSSSSQKYKFTLVVDNPNMISKISYKQQGSTVVLTLEKHEVGVGKFPDLEQGTGETISDVALSITGNAELQPRNRTNLELSMIVPVQITTAFFVVEDSVLQVKCKIEVDKLDTNKKPNMLSQSCITEGR